ncbi:MAG: branched-chain amino acid ABC transporter permease [Gammaproteobacteria bacterium]|nr:branched-chain amino acid ABC transporter permease [Gammaproteobacteria bacterium]NIR84887.1 branched-chain amino acid ABC transporter permease [Gammaproteobacteria bacterium]NIR91736.1 branched-chain amino acid ABC transporter permease [Gammaproteobacteria bacterium]NIU05934.1 branched-chain amino acid ABC transporter permease [Gammaproteobacteria bacterium]NIV52981.1 branched-chain amino acid ABC transporter permease [Gammaproteobacteria bacterium]
MDWVLVLEQLLNGLQLGILLFLLAAGLTLVFGIMDLVNLAHGSLYMVGAFFCATFYLWSGSYVVGILLAVPAILAVGILVEVTVLRTLYERDHLDQVLATFGLILFFNELALIVWPPDGLTVPVPSGMDRAVPLFFGIQYPAFRVLIIAVGLLVALGLYLLVARTRLGMLIRAGASNRTMAGALGVNIKLLFTLVFGLGAVLAGLAGMLILPILSATSGMGEQIIILAFVVIVIGGIGSIRGALISALIIGVIDTLGRSFLDELMLAFLPANAAEAAGPALSAMLIYILMAVVLFFRPQGLFPPR